ncbi:hypothetical protein [Ancylobacter defluvii]|uniref:hypothetical protein n=1 Tax=Ancylobacter defluvii TaxID=1282440 RepID=UPI001BD02170|nr:hypothetical protein [Ancylobacter defluvii]MBS7588883.1 hypothetical protein [Ancylobacter defluvii]
MPIAVGAAGKDGTRPNPAMSAAIIVPVSLCAGLGVVCTDNAAAGAAPKTRPGRVLVI